MSKQILNLIAGLDNLPADHDPDKDELWGHIREIERLAKADRSQQLATETIAGGLTRDNLLDCFKFLDGALPLVLMLNHITVCDVLKFTGGGVDRELLTKEGLARGSQIEGVYSIVTMQRDNVPDDQVRILASNGRLYIFNFV